jgi:oxygen-independent coproporphyrinogen-3 oxidase
MNTPELEVDLALLARLECNAPRYTSYPTADRFGAAFDSRTYAAWAARRNSTGMRRALSLYVHLPFCQSLCYFCACNKIVTRDASKGLKYLQYLTREIALQAPLFRDDARVEQLHWGGGTPTFYDLDDLGSLFQTLRNHFELAPQGDYSIEIDPRTIDAQALVALREMGFNRLSLGVQDFDPHVQQAINRVQCEEQVCSLIQTAKALQFASVNVDLVYGLPRQSIESFTSTLQRLVAARPDRVAVYSYAHLPARFKAQRMIREAELPSAERKLQLLGCAAQQLTGNGYVYIGMDHFALPGDALALAQRQGRLQRNFQGYSTHADCDIAGLGVSAIGAIGPTYSQNAKTLTDYYARLDRNDLPIVRGLELNRDDLVRRSVIHALMCQFQVSKEQIGVSYLIDFDDYFADELQQLGGFEREGLLEMSGEWIGVTPRGRMVVRNICMVFDRYLRTDNETQKYSSSV